MAEVESVFNKVSGMVAGQTNRPAGKKSSLASLELEGEL
jgi:hypothetical protein